MQCSKANEHVCHLRATLQNAFVTEQLESTHAAGLRFPEGF